MKIALGTVQFGLAYGVTNQAGQVEIDEAKKILTAAAAAGIDTLDTASGYGDSERVLGQIGSAGFRIVSKIISSRSDDHSSPEWIDQQVQNSLNDLKLEHIDAVLFHRTHDLLAHDGKNWEHLNKIKESGRVAKIGVSISSSDELDALWQIARPDIVQAPMNIFDQRLQASGWLDKLYQHDVEVHIRSLFLQGSLLVDFKELPDYFSRWQKHYKQLEQYVHDAGITRIAACLQPFLNDSRIARIVLGVQSQAQLDQIITEVKQIKARKGDPVAFPNNDLDLIDPSRWQH